MRVLSVRLNKFDDKLAIDVAYVGDEEDGAEEVFRSSLLMLESPLVRPRQHLIVLQLAQCREREITLVFVIWHWQLFIPFVEFIESLTEGPQYACDFCYLGFVVAGGTRCQRNIAGEVLHDGGYCINGPENIDPGTSKRDEECRAKACQHKFLTIPCTLR